MGQNFVIQFKKEATKMTFQKSVLYIGNFNTRENVAAFNRAIGILKLFSKLGYECHMILNQDDELVLNAFKFCTFHLISVSKKTFYLKSSFIIDVVKSISGLTDIVLYNYPSVPFFTIRRYAKNRGITVICDCTEWYDTSDVSLFKKPIKWLDTFVRMNICNYSADGVIVISKLLEKKYMSLNHILIYPIITKNYEVFPVRQTFHEGPFKFVYSGFSGKKKDDLIGFSKYLTKIGFNNYVITLIGKMHPQTLNYFDSNDIRYIHLGYKTHEEALKCVLQNECQIIIRKNNRRNNAGFPTKLAESIYFRVPVIANSFSDISCLNGDYIFCIDKDGYDLNSFFWRVRNNSVNFEEDREFFIEDHYYKCFQEFLGLLGEHKK